MTKIAQTNQSNADMDYALKNLSSEITRKVLNCGKTLYANGARFLENLPQGSAVSPEVGTGKAQAKTVRK